MLPRKYRLSRKDIDSIKLNSKKSHSPFLTVLYKKNEIENPRFAITVSKKVSKSAVYRNKLKRVLRMQIRANLEKFKNQDFLIIVKNSASKENFDKFTEDAKKTIASISNNL